MFVCGGISPRVDGAAEDRAALVAARLDEARAVFAGERRVGLASVTSAAIARP